MREEKLLEAIGEIDDRLIEEAVPGKKKKVRHINWFRYGSIAACFLLVIILVYGASTIRMGSKEEAAADAAAPEEFIQEDAAVEESAVEEEAAAEAPAETEEAPAEDAPAEEETPAGEEGLEEETNPTDNEEDIVDVAYGITVNGRTYFPISFEERKQFGLVPEDAIGLTPENTYQVKDSDLGEVIGDVTDCEKEKYIGLTLYHFADYPENDVIGILDNNGTYEFYVCDK